MSTRRQFLKNAALVSLAPFVPAFLPRSLRADDAKVDDRILVVIQLDGGNDGLNTVIPYADENYAKHRNELRIPEKDIIKLNDSIGLHPGMKAAAELFQNGRLAIVQGVGYPNPNRSHFESMAIWHHAQPNAERHDKIGWLGRAADVSRRFELASPDSVYVGSDEVPVALRGRRSNAISMASEADLKLLTPIERSQPAQSANDLAAFVSRTVDQSYEAAQRFSESASSMSSDTKYPGSELAARLKLVSQLIKLGGGTRIYYVSQSGYDTHSAQAWTHRELLNAFSRGLEAFLNDLRDAKLEDRVTVMAFSEFGRRVQENGSAGTDHGVAGPMFLAGARVQRGITGNHPSLTDLDEGDLKISIDFRQVYQSALTDWIGISAQPVLGEEFASLKLFAV
jgi:uncharacterized protein (DUF1501 family)